MTKRYGSVIVLMLSIVTGCSSGEDQTANETTSDENVLKQQSRAIEKAQGVEQLLQDSAEKQRKQIEQQGGQ